MELINVSKDATYRDEQHTHTEIQKAFGILYTAKDQFSHCNSTNVQATVIIYQMINTFILFHSVPHKSKSAALTSAGLALFSVSIIHG